MPDLEDGETAEVQGSGSASYVLKNVGGVYSCSCPAWLHQSLSIESRSCKHLRAFRGDEQERARVGDAAVRRPRRPQASPGGGGAVSTAPGQAPRVMLAHKWDGATDISGWWLSEKLDGVRAYWDGQQFLSRQGNLFCAPEWFTENLPYVPLDGELWGGRKRFQRTVSVVRRQDRSDDWREITYYIFDAPAVPEPFEGRLEAVRQALALLRPAHARLLGHQRCRDARQLQQELARVEALGGEGLMLRQPGSRYQSGRCSFLLKVKNFHDAEGRVVAHLPGAGRHEGRLGALQLELPDGTIFSAGTGLSDSEREHPPPVGSIVTFRFQELTNDGTPRFPSYVGVRHDLAWEQIEWPPPGSVAPPVSNPPPPLADDLSVVEPPAELPLSMTPSAQAPAAAPPPAPAPPEPEPELPRDQEVHRRVEFAGSVSTKLWQVDQDGPTLHITRGRLGREAIHKELTFHTAAEAARHANKQIEAKLMKGYEERFK